VLRLFLDSPIDVALTQFQAKHKLGRSYAGLVIFIEGLRKLNLINEVGYQHYKNRYMKPLRTLIEEDPLQTRREDEFKKDRKQLQDVLEQFVSLQPKAQKYWLKYASDHPEIPESTELLRKHQKSD
jgi:hypothetical protein